MNDRPNETEDDHFGLLKWDEEEQAWTGLVTIPPHEEEVGLVLPSEYIDSDEVRTHIWEMLRIIERDECGFRERAADELFKRRAHLLYWPKDQPFDRDAFATEMHLGLITFDTEFPDMEISLGYEYGEGMEHGIVIYLTWNGLYQQARTGF